MDRETSRSRSGLNVLEEISKMEQELKDFQARIVGRKINQQLERETDAYQTAKSGLDLVRDLGIFGFTPKKVAQPSLPGSQRASQPAPSEDLLATHSFSFEARPRSVPMDEESHLPVFAADSRTGEASEFTSGLAAKITARSQTVALGTAAHDASLAGLSNPLPLEKPAARERPKSKVSLPTADSIQSSRPLVRPALSQHESELLANYLKLSHEELAGLAASFGIKDRGRETMKRMVKEVHDWYYLDRVGKELVRGFKDSIVEHLHEAHEKPLEGSAK